MKIIHFVIPKLKSSVPSASALVRILIGQVSKGHERERNVLNSVFLLPKKKFKHCSPSK
jgi:hypothetical protein